MMMALAAPASFPAGAGADAAREAAVSARLEAVRDDPLRLHMLLAAMPKGGDLHNHLSGAVYAEDYLAWAARDGFCVDAAGSGVVPPPCAPGRALAGMAEDRPFDFARMVDALSTRGVRDGREHNELSDHTRFFRSFGRFGAVARNHVGASLAAVRQLAAEDGVSYVELIHNPPAIDAYLASAPADATVPDTTALPSFLTREMARAERFAARAIVETDQAEQEAHVALGCDRAAAAGACAVTVRYLSAGMRAMPPAEAFRTLIFGYALALRDTRFRGVNIVQPEDWPVPLRDYALHMDMLRLLHARYPQVRRSLHAGELAPGLAPPAALRDHIAGAIDAGAERIGHGTAIAFEQNSAGTLARMARDRIAVEINLTSNDVILGVKGPDHPLRLYLEAGVPVVLSTDDEGVLRTDMTNEYVRAVREHGLGYADLKRAARASLEYSFLAGRSLWSDAAGARPVAECARSLTEAMCRRVVGTSERARLQADLEARLDRFERETVPPPHT